LANIVKETEAWIKCTDEYDSKEDVARIAITPSHLQENQERLLYEIVAKSEYEFTINIAWDKVQLQIPISLNIPNID